MSIYDYKVNDYKGNEVDLSIYKGKVLLIVNTATKCGFTPQYDGLEALYAKYKDKGFEILDFPCNQFFAQAPGSSEEIHNACVLRFMIAFPQFEKIDVNGKKEHPLYRYLKDNCPVKTGKNIKWNFTKFLVDRDGNIVNRFEPTEKPEEFEDKIAELL
ncbi:MAG: glutathione peroxidase [Gammaproteobacteria bacterium]|nr:glutathione peroxidase [Gammaproteobacteria bacterium]